MTASTQTTWSTPGVPGLVRISDPAGQLTGALRSEMALHLPIVTKNDVAYTGSSDKDRVVIMNPTTADRAFTFPTAVGCPGCYLTVIKGDAGANHVTFAMTSAQTMSGGAAPADLTTQGAKFTAVSDGANWWAL